jgi:hypothetical protein
LRLLQCCRGGWSGHRPTLHKHLGRRARQAVRCFSHATKQLH